jgi:hypothetical protein
MEKLSCADRVKNEEVLQRTKELELPPYNKKKEG